MPAVDKLFEMDAWIARLTWSLPPHLPAGSMTPSGLTSKLRHDHHPTSG